jgi:hypothetical protein
MQAICLKILWIYTLYTSQKKFTVGFLTKQVRKNEGEVERYYIHDSHPPIVEREVFDLVREEMAHRRNRTAYGSAHLFSGRIVCSECGAFFAPKTWHSTNKYRKVVWRCGAKYEKGTRRKTSRLIETQIQQAFVGIFNEFFCGSTRLGEEFQPVMEMLGDNSVI